MALVSDSMALTMLRAVGAGLVTINSRRITALFISEYQRVQLDSDMIIESHDPMILCRSSDARLVAARKDDLVDGLPQEFAVKEDDGGDRTEILGGDWQGFTAIMLRRV